MQRRSKCDGGTEEPGQRSLLFLLLAVAFSSNLCKGPSDGADPMIVYGGLTDANPDWSPDGSTIVYTHVDETIINDSTRRSNPESTGLWFIGWDGSYRRMFSDSLVGIAARWSPDGRWLLFVMDYQIWKIKVSGDSLAQVPSDPDARISTCSWSPDGTRIALDRDQDGPAGIWTMQVDGSDLRFIGYGYCPDWSPDGYHILYCGYSAQGQDYVGVMDTNGEDCGKVVSTDEGGLGMATYSPDGSQIAIAGKISGRRGLFTVSITGQHLRFLAKDGCMPSWSPDGKKIVFAYLNAEEKDLSDSSNGVLYIINADGSGLRQLTFGPKP